MAKDRPCGEKKVGTHVGFSRQIQIGREKQEMMMENASLSAVEIASLIFSTLPPRLEVKECILEPSRAHGTLTSCL